MLFNSIEFLLFFIIVYAVYLLLSHKWQNIFLLLASSVFYAWWDWRFLTLIFLSAAVDFFCGLKIQNSDDQKRKKLFLILSICVNLSILGFFKYFNFFAANLRILLDSFGLGSDPLYFKVILPMGISFYTFQTMSYTIDIYRNRMKATDSFFNFALFVAFFPQLVAGPIERARNLLPQILKPRKISAEMLSEGVYLLFWGFFQKIFIADNLAPIVDKIFTPQSSYNGAIVYLGVFAYSFQIFCDFAGYSNIARGLAKCMGFNIMVNFRIPIFARNPVELWQRWHISLSSWFRDYVYKTFRGQNRRPFMMYLSIMLTMFLTGFWHGAAWTFIIWGLYHGLLICIHRFLRPVLKYIFDTKITFINTLGSIFRIIVFFHFWLLGLLIFRAVSISQFFDLLKSIVFNFKIIWADFNSLALSIIAIIWLLLIVQIIQFLKDDLMYIYSSNKVVVSLFYAVCIYFMLKNGIPNGHAFIYYIF